ncbi:hypothetical protein DFP72DRAFT_630832 [Ephemerocybe angulata]|uniref:Nephrocystin 3-like N-terminal domain-containing protein n=1 Tax=Ephemerocybe angulata TaxID=980116 RepID=A0A8H6IA95_9AGAR|nr:hypothetical protein DFP72DRAFT_630832 [Tulosesus angulatus]
MGGSSSSRTRLPTPYLPRTPGTTPQDVMKTHVLKLQTRSWDGSRDRAAPQSLLCMTGAAGAGKSALQQTVAELCTNLGIFASCFFFSSSDGTRNNVSRITPTIAYQLGLKNPALRRSIATAVEDDPLIFKQTLKIQIERLIVRPISRLPPQDLARFPYAVFIDGLDECAEEDRQRELLAALKACFLNGRTPFRIFLASRPELPIFEALQPGGYLREVAYHIRLSDDYDASADIRRTAQRRLTELGQRRQLERDWYSERDVEAIVEAASGQYIYAATAIRYLSDSRGSPAERLRTIINWAPGKDIKGKGPMAALDLLYTNIVLRAKEGYEAAGTNNQLDFVLILKCYIVIGGYIFHSLRDYDSMLELEYGTHERILCDLRSLITVNDEKDTAAIQRSGALVFYHKSFKDFLRSEIRAGSLFLSENEVHDHLFLCGLRMMAKWPATTFSNAFTENGPITFGGSNTYIRLVKSVSMEAGNRCYGRLNRDHPPSEAVVDAFIVFARDSSGLNKIDNWIVSSEGTSAEQEGNRNDWLAIQDTLLPYVKKKDSVLAATAKEYSMKWKNIKSKHRR